MRKKLISALLSLALIVALTPTVAYGATGYTDVNTNDWYYPAVEYMAGQGYMTGYSATQFAPNDTLSRAMFVTVLYRVSGEKVKGTSERFTDVANGTWYTEAVAWAVENEITSGTSATTFSPNAPVTREQMAVFIKRYIDNKNIKVSDNFIVTSTLQDINQSSGWAKDAVEFMYQHGILLERDHEIWPTSYAIRRDTAIAFYNLLCLTNGINNSLLLSNNYYDGSINISCNHSWATRHVEEVGHMESNGTHTVWHFVCDCGNFDVWGDDPDCMVKRNAHYHPLTGCKYGYVALEVEKPNSSVWVVDISEHDEVYCIRCGAIQ